jgi:methylase of polypeptide subunit release factors
MIAAEASLSHARSPGMNVPGREPLRIAELTSGSGLIGLHLLRIERNSTLLGLDLDPAASTVAADNAEMLALTRRVRFTRADLNSRNTENLLLREKAQLLVCNPPYVPEPPDGKLPVEAGAGPDGTAHLMRALELARIVRPRALALSWCSLSDPEKVVREAEKSGYRLNSLFVALIADGEYSGAVGGYLRSLSTAFLNDSQETLRVVAPDSSASFGYLLMSGEFSRADSRIARAATKASEQVRTICSRFTRRGLAALESVENSFSTRVWLLDRWDEVRLRAYLHGEVSQLLVAPP